MSRAGRLLESCENARLGSARHGSAGGAAPRSVPHGTAPGGCAPLGTARSRGPAPRPGPLGSAPGFVRAGTPGCWGRPRPCPGLEAGPRPPPGLVAGSPVGARCPSPRLQPPADPFVPAARGGADGGPAPRPRGRLEALQPLLGKPPRQPPAGARCPEPRGCRGQRAVPGRPVQAAPRWRRPLPPGCPGVPRWAPMAQVRVPPPSGNGSGEIPTRRAECNGFGGGACPRYNLPGTGPTRGAPGTTRTTGPGGTRGTAGLRPLQLWAGGWRVKTGP